MAPVALPRSAGDKERFASRRACRSEMNGPFAVLGGRESFAAPRVPISEAVVRDVQIDVAVI
eukprot:2809167-Pyramimonas_sp.AAC.1